MTPPSNPPIPDWEVIGRYLAGESSPEEAAAIRRWLDENKADAEVLAALDGVARRAATPEVDVERALLRVKSRAKAGVTRAGVRFTIFAAVAAAFWLVAVLVPWERLPIGIGVDLETASRQRMSFATQVGQHDSIVLPDSSLVVLGPDSRIQYVIAAGRREVQLEGQAFFRVVHDANRPFVVRAGATTIRDIGTEFSVHSDAAEPVRVVVHEGAVEVIAADSATLRPGDVGVVGEGGRVQTSRGAATPDDLAWTRGRLVFRDAAIAEVAPDLRRWYGVELRVTDSALARRHFTGEFAGEPVDRVLDVIALAVGARVERRGDTAYIRRASPR
ncbi:MAG: FecR domain-containing protein [Gemmatimonadaceae bacterium]